MGQRSGDQPEMEDMSWAQRIAWGLVQGAAKPDLKFVDTVLALIGETPEKKPAPEPEARPVQAIELSGLTDAELAALATAEE